MTREEAERIALAITEEIKRSWHLGTWRDVVVSVDCERGWEAAAGWYVRIDKAEEEE